MVIAIDIGNSSINIGFFAKSDLFVKNIPAHPLLPSSKYVSLVNGFIKEKNMEKKPEGIIISSVVPGHTKVLKHALKKLTGTEPLLVSCRIRTGLKFAIPRPEALGSDRIANAVAAYEMFQCPAAAVDFGTATTISVVGKKANYIGGAIMPGIRLLNESLAKGTSQLYTVQVKSPVYALGSDTAEVYCHNFLKENILFRLALPWRA